MKISLRLQQLDKMIIKNYENIWDCCCDHGLLGLMLLQRHAAKKIHFVDIIKDLTNNLNEKLKCYFSDTSFKNCWQVHCLDIKNLVLPKTKNSQNLIIIAGVGGDKLIEFVTAILTNNAKKPIEFLLCPIHHHYKVRQALQQQGLGLINESLIQENNRFYEVIHVSNTTKKPIVLVGSIMWDFSRQDNREYLNRTIAHYQLKSKNGDTKMLGILSAYQALMFNV